jgi:hypothetical protein
VERLVDRAMPSDREKGCDRGNGFLPAPAACSALTTDSRYGYKWIPAPITTVRDGHKLPKGTAETRVGSAAWKWITETCRSSTMIKEIIQLSFEGLAAATLIFTNTISFMSRQ